MIAPDLVPSQREDFIFPARRQQYHLNGMGDIAIRPFAKHLPQRLQLNWRKDSPTRRSPVATDADAGVEVIFRQKASRHRESEDAFQEAKRAICTAWTGGSVIFKPFKDLGAIDLDNAAPTECGQQGAVCISP
jgi:hypothetical protein